MTGLINRRGRRTLSASNYADLMFLAATTILAALLVWLGASAWPNVPVILVGLLATVTFYEVVVKQRINRWVSRFRRSGEPTRIVVRHISREQEREQRGKRRYGFVTFIVGVAVTTLVTVAATYGAEWLARLRE